MPDSSSLYLSDQILPSDEGVEPIHDREYRVRAYRLGPDRLLLRGGVRDQKPPGLYIANDPDPVTVHHMVVELEVTFPELVIERAQVTFETFPHTTCSRITTHYRNLEGLSIARGFTHKVRELFGGPRGCTHTTALLLAMAPVAVQSGWSMRCADEPVTGVEPELRIPFGRGPADDSWKVNINTCHEWAEGGPAYERSMSGAPWGVPVFLRARAASFDLELGPEP